MVVYISQQLNQLTGMLFFPRAAEDVELWFSEVENLLAVEDLGKVCYGLSLEFNIVHDCHLSRYL